VQLLLVDDEVVGHSVVEGPTVVSVRLVLVAVIVVVTTSVDVAIGSLHPNQPGSLHVLVVWLVEAVVDGMDEVGLGAGCVVAGSPLSLQPHQPGVRQVDVVVVVVHCVSVVVVEVVVKVVLKSDRVETELVVVV
jgi:hypothetical protein